MFDENPAALCAVPKPMLGSERLITGIVFEKTVEEFSKDFRLNQTLDGLKERVVPLHEVCQNKQPFLSSQGDHFVGLVQIHRQGFLADDVLAGLESLHSLRMVQKRRS